MYINGTIKTRKTAAIIAELRKRAEYLKKSTYCRIPHHEIDSFFESEEVYGHKQTPGAEYLAADIAGLLSAMKSGRSVFFVLEKYPARGLDYGRNWYSLRYVTKEGKQTRLWPHGNVGAAILGMDENNRDRYLPKWMFSSGAIGMDRALNATETLCRLLAKVGGFQSCQFTHGDCL